ncbi:ABC transporter ATP-binding protein [Candidatus Poribacteria bacterium]|nr:ABC transporter ATP-binding protein [Candidatus Poribacteria bacterium]
MLRSENGRQEGFLVVDTEVLHSITTDSRQPIADSQIQVENLSHAYQQRQALDNISFDVSCGEIFGFLGPNGSGKTTLFRILSTLMPVTAGTVRIFGHDLATEVKAIRKLLGVVFQHPGLDTKLTVVENLRHHGHLYGLAGKALRHQISELLERFGVSDRSAERVEVLSGGLQRRVEIAKALLHSPRVLLLDEPTSGLDVTARRQLNDHLGMLARTENILVLMTTHLLDDAEACNRVGILDEGKLVALGEPDELKAKVGGDVILIESENRETLREVISERFGFSPVLTDNQLRVECERGHEFVRDVVAAFPDEIQSVRFGKPTLEDVFVKLTGNPFM